MASYIQNSPAGAEIVEPKFQLKRAAGTNLDTISPPFLGFVLDRSGSMGSLAQEAITGFNTLLSEQQTTNPRALLSLSLFDHEILPLHDAVPLPEVMPLTGETYVPRGGTALNDAIGAMIQQIGKAAKRSTRVLIAILTDGGENSSRSFSAADILSMVTYRRTTYDWQFIFLGPEDALSYALSIGIPKSNVVAFNTDPAGIKSILQLLSKSITAYQLGDRRYALKLRN